MTVDFLEMLSSVGGSVLSPDGMKATIGSPQAPQVLKFMQQGLKDGAAPQANPTYMEEESRNAFQIGKVLLLRNWPYVYALAEQAHVNFGVEPLRSGRAASQRVCWAATTWGSRPLRRSRRLMRLTLPGRSGPNVRPEMTWVCG